VLPALFAQADLVILATVGAVAAGVSTTMFADQAAGGSARAGAAWGEGLRRGLTLFLVNLPMTLIAVLLSYGLDAWLEARGSAGRTRQFARLAAVGLVFVSQAWFLYVNALVMLARRGWAATMAALPRTASRGMVGAFFMAIVTLLPLFALQAVSSLGTAMVDRGRPETVGWLAVVQIVAGLIASFLLTGGSAVFFQSELAEREAER
jgi:hypothetical protein